MPFSPASTMSSSSKTSSPIAFCNFNYLQRSFISSWVRGSSLFDGHDGSGCSITASAKVAAVHNQNEKTTWSSWRGDRRKVEKKFRDIHYFILKMQHPRVHRIFKLTIILSFSLWKLNFQKKRSRISTPEINFIFQMIFHCDPFNDKHLDVSQKLPSWVWNDKFCLFY